MADVNVPTECVPPITTPLLTDAGLLTWPWILYFNCLGRGSRRDGTRVMGFNACLGLTPVVPRRTTYRNVFVHKKGTALAAFAIASQPPTGSALIADVRQNGVSILGPDKLTIPAGSGACIKTTAFASTPVSAIECDIFDAWILQVGSTFPGEHISIFVLWAVMQ